MTLRLTLGVGCIAALAAFAATSASAAPLTDWSASAEAGLAFAAGLPNDTHSWNIGGAVAGPLGVPNLNFEADAGYNWTWANNFHANSFDFGGDLFWAGAMGRLGVQIGWSPVEHQGSQGRGGVFGEWYFGPLTAMASGGWVNASGSGTGGRGGYLSGALEAYFMPDLGITAGVLYDDIVSGRGCQFCGRGDYGDTTLGLTAEYLFSEQYGLAGYLGYAYDRYIRFDNSPGGGRLSSDTYLVGLRWYLGGGSLVDHHRNGTLNPFLSE